MGLLKDVFYKISIFIDFSKRKFVELYFNKCDFSEYLSYKNCKCKIKLIDELVDECTANIEETSLVEITSTECNFVENKRRHNSCTLYICVIFNNLFNKHWN